MRLPRLAPPAPERSLVSEYVHAARLAGVRPFDWQKLAASYAMALGPRGRWLFAEFAAVIARQNGKTTFLEPRIIRGLLAGERIMHTAQNRELPREVFGRVADAMAGPKLAAGVRSIRTANGQEQIRMRNGALYRIVAPTRGGARGPSNDLLIVDEVRELDSWEFVAAARPTLIASRNPQIIWLSNAGERTSSVLNSLRDRSGLDPSLCYLEWSAHPDRAISDRDGWREANPSLGLPRGRPLLTMATLEQAFTAYELSGELAIFETEHLCRWVGSMLPRPVSDVAWNAAARDVGDPVRPAMGVSVNAAGSRASAALAWIQADGSVALTIAGDVTGTPLDLDRFGQELRQYARSVRAVVVAYDPATDRDLVRHLRSAKPVSGDEYAAASDRFVRTIEAGRLRHAGAAAIGADLAFTGKQERDRGSWMIVPADADRPVTAALAAIRAVWMATAPAPARPRIHAPG